MIDEKKLIEEIKKRRDYWESKAAEYDEAGERYEYLMDVCDGKANEQTKILSIVNEQPEIGEWIPCSERLPEEDGCYLVTWKDLEPWSGFPHYYEIVEYDPNDEDLWIGDIPQARGEYAILAWQPLPEPWGGEDK